MKGWVKPLSKGRAGGFRVYSLVPPCGRRPRGRQAWCQSPSFTQAPAYAFSAAREARAASGSGVAVVEWNIQKLDPLIWGSFRASSKGFYKGLGFIGGVCGVLLLQKEKGPKLRVVLCRKFGWLWETEVVGLSGSSTQVKVP